MSTYSPQPGTVAYRALAFLETLPRGAEVSTAQLAEAIGHNRTALPICLAPAVFVRAVFSRQKGGHARSPLFWSLVDHQAAEVSDKPASLSPSAGNAAPAHRTTPVRDSQQVLKAEGDGPDATARETPAMRSPVGGPMGAGQPAAAGPAEDATPAGAIPVGDGSQKPDDAAAIPGARAGRVTPQQGANRDASAGQSHVAEGSASPAGRGADGPTARGAAPDFSTDDDDRGPAVCRHGVLWHVRCFVCEPGASQGTDAEAYIAAIHRQHPPDPAPARLPVKRGVRAALWSTGELAIETADEVIVFEGAAAEQVIALIRRGAV